MFKKSVTSKPPFVLLVNPWITDFAAYDLWAKPLGLLSLASLLREGGYAVAYVDCLDRHDADTGSFPEVESGVARRYGTGKYPKVHIPKPRACEEVPRRYYRYGIHPESLYRQLRNLPRPDLVMVTSIMTYWYPGVRETIAMVKEVFGGTPIWVGGVYARLCPDHARLQTGATEVIASSAEHLVRRIEAATGYTLKNRCLWNSFADWPSPALDLMERPAYAPIQTSIGCPFHCPYCASGKLQPRWLRRHGDAVYREVRKWHRERGIVDFAFYDDALLLDAEDTLGHALKRLLRDGLKVRFHTPNAVHIRAITPEWAQLLFESGFTTIRLGLETTSAAQQTKWGGKVETEMFFSAVSNLLRAGFAPHQIGVYLLCGLPGQTPSEVAQSIRTVHEAGVMPFLSEYSPVPGTVMWEEAVATCTFDLQGEPLFHNNTLFACRRPDFSYDDLQSLKALARQARHLLLDHESDRRGDCSFDSQP